MATGSRLVRRRERVYLTLSLCMLACSVTTSAAYWFAVRSRIRSVSAAVVDFSAALDKVRGDVSAQADALRVLVNAAARSSASSATGSGVEAFGGPVVVGRGTTKGYGGRRYAYIDYRQGTNGAERIYIPIHSSLPKASVDDGEE